MRLALFVLPLLALAAFPAPAADATAGPICTYDLIESVAVCVGPGRCVTVFLGPSARTVCAPPVCTTSLIESVGVCEDPATGCIHVWTGPADHPVCTRATATEASPICATWDPTYVCIEPPCVYGSFGYLPFRECLSPRALLA